MKCASGQKLLDERYCPLKGEKPEPVDFVGISEKDEWP